MSIGVIPRKRRGRFRWMLNLLLLLLVALPLLVSASVFGRVNGVPWYEARRDATGLAPDPAATNEAVIQVYAARAVAWRGIFAMHTWIAVKPTNAPRFTRYEVIGFGVSEGAPAVRIDRTGPDNYWFGATPEVVLDRRGPGVDALIEKVKAAVGAYPYPQSYRAWPGPNSNTFTAFVGRAVPELGLDLPANAARTICRTAPLFAATPSGTGYQLSLLGLAGLLAARKEGVELNLLGLTFGIDFASPGIKLPGIGRLGLPAGAEPQAQAAGS